MKRKQHILHYLVCFSLLATLIACQKANDGFIEYKAEPRTDVGTKLVQGTDLIATIFSDSTYTLTSGVQATELFYFSRKGYATHLFLFEVDLSNPSITMEVSTPNNANAHAFETVREQAVHEDAAGHMVWGGVNGSFFNTATGAPYGLLYKNGSMIQMYNASYPNFFAITKDNKAIVADADAYESVKDNIQEALGGGVMLVKNGALVTQTEAVPSINPRTCVGVSEDARKAYVMAVDGRNYHYSNGMTYEELGRFMIALGAKNALNLDGGGSTTFFIRNTPEFTAGRFELRNWPSENGGEERGVANGLLIIAK